MPDLPKADVPPPAPLDRRTLLRSGVGGGLVVLTGGGAWWLRGRRPAPLTRGTRPLMGTVAEVLIAHPGPEAGALVRAALEAIAGVERRMTRFNAVSEIGRVNAAPGRFHPVSPMTAHVVRTALETARDSDGRFDPGLGALGRKWGIYGGGESGPRFRVPTARIEAPSPGYRGIQLSGDADRFRLRVDDDAVQLDLGGIAKGYAVELAVDLLRERGVGRALVNVGGDIHALGTHPEGRPWQVGVRHPRQPGRLLGVLKLQDCAVATSGDYERYAIRGGQRIHHLLDPRSGGPAPFHQSVTVTAPGAMVADALATAAFATPPTQARRLLRRLAPGEWITVDGAGRIARG